MSKETKDTLIEVRKAYRFLYKYQRKVLDLISYIGGSYGLNYSGGFTKFSNSSPRNGKGNLTNWAWDWLSMYYYEFNFEKFQKDNDTYIFSIFLINDSGYFMSNNKEKIYKTKVSAFESEEESETKLIFVIGKNIWEGWGINWDNPEFILQIQGKKIKEENQMMLFKNYNLEEFENEEKALTRLKDFESYCTENGLNFKIKERKFE